MLLPHLVRSNESKSSQTPSEPARRPKGKALRMGIEALESRELFVVGATALPAAVAPGTGFDGVAQLSFSTGFSCTGSLLWTGRHILTAAHCVDTDNNGLVDPGTASVRFDMPSGPITINNIPMTNVIMHSGFGGSASGGNDIALITLPVLPPSGTPGATGAERYQIYRNSDEVRQVFTFAGYGRTDSLNPDGTLRSDCTMRNGGVKRLGQNRFDSVSGTFLRFDFDRGTAADAVAGEADTAPGDSGGPSFIGGRIAAVTSFGVDVNCRFGDLASNTRVSTFASWIDTNVGGTYDLVLDMNKQVLGNDGRADEIQVRRNGANLEILVNGTVYHSDLLSNIRSVSVIGSNDDDTILALHPLRTTVDGGGGTDTLVGPDRNNNWQIAGLNSGAIDRWGRFSSIENVKGGSRDDIFQFADRARLTGFISGREGVDMLDYSGYGVGVSVNLQENRGTGTETIADIEDVKGSREADTIIGNSLRNRLYGHDGNDSIYGMGGDDVLAGGSDSDWLYGNMGRDLLIGGGGADALDGGEDDDILIGARLTGSYTDVMREWTRTDADYTTRVNHLRFGGGLNGTTLLNSSTVEIDDGQADALVGGGGLDWFWGLTTERRDRLATEFVNGIS